MRVFLTGVSGGLGTLLADRLAPLSEIECVTGIDVAEPKRRLPSRVRFVKMDIRSPELASAMAGHDTVIHTAFLGLWPARIPASVRDDINLNGVRSVARAAVANHVQRFIHTSSTAAYDPDSAVGKTALTEDFPIGRGDNRFYYSSGKAIAERAVTEILGQANTTLTILRPCAFVGPRCPQTTLIMQDTASLLIGRNPRTQFAHEEDVAASFLQALKSNLPGAYNVAPDDFILDRDVWKLIGKKWLAPVPWFVLTRYVWVRWRFLGAPTHPNWLWARISDFTISNEKLKATGWKPRYSSAEALRSIAGKESFLGARSGPEPA